MKLSNIKLAMAASTLLLASGAYAEDGTINFTGSIIDSSCVVNTNGSANSTGSVDLGKVSTQSLNTAGATAAPTQFSIKVTNCKVGSTVAIQFDGTAHSVNKDILAITGSGTEGVADNVGVAIYNQDSTSILPLNSASKIQTTDNDGSAEFPFTARYYATAAVTAGTANATATFNIAYQ